MKSNLRLLIAAWLGIGMVNAATAAEPFAESHTVAASAALAARLPDAVDFTVAAPGTVTVVLTDLQSQVSFSSLQAVVTRGATKVLTLATPGTQQFQATAGNYKVQVVGKVPSAFGLFRVDVRTATNQILASSTAQVSSGVPVSAGQTPLRYTLQPGTYQVSLRDLALPAGLQFADLGIFAVGGSGAPLRPIIQFKPNSSSCTAATCNDTFTITQAGAYDFILAAGLVSPNTRGLYTLSITGPGSALVSADAYAVGDLPDPAAITIPAAGTYTLSLADLLAPGGALGTLRAVLVQGANPLASLPGDGSATTTGAVTGAAKLFVITAPGATGLGAFSVQLRNAGSQLVYSTADTTPSGLTASQTAAGYRFEADVPATADYRLVLRDLQFPSAFSTLRAMVVPSSGANTLAAPGTLTTPLAAGKVFVLVTATKPASADAMFGIALEPLAAGSTPLISKAQGVGALFDTRNVQITQAGPYDLTVSDLQFPAAMSELTVAITRGPELVGQIFGSAGINFTAQPGEYAVNLLARPAAGADYGTWAFSVTGTPRPTVTLSATPVLVNAQGTATLNWSTTAATSCTASGGWSGTRSTSGTATSTALAAQTVFNLTCIGPGGTDSASVTVDVSPPPGGGGGGGGGGQGGGGGAIDALLLCLALVLIVLRQRVPSVQRTP